MIDQCKSKLLPKYGAQILMPPPPTAETLNWYDPLETLNMINNSAWLNKVSESSETL
jgi:hypothetical protein